MAMMCRTRLMRRLPASGEAVALLVAGGGVQGRGAVPGGEVAGCGEAGDVADEAGRAGGSDPVEPAQCAAGRVGQFGELRVGGFDLFVDGDEFGDQLGSQLAPSTSDDVAWADSVEQSSGLGCGKERLGSAGQQLQQEFVDAVDGFGAGAAEPVATVDEKSQRHGGVVGGDRPQIVGA
jgi:hypothetical protein